MRYLLLHYLDESAMACASLQEAIELAARHPTAKAGTFELRPFRD